MSIFAAVFGLCSGEASQRGLPTGGLGRALFALYITFFLIYCISCRSVYIHTNVFGYILSIEREVPTCVVRATTCAVRTCLPPARWEPRVRCLPPARCEHMDLPPAWCEPSISHRHGEGDVSPTCVVGARGSPTCVVGAKHLSPVTRLPPAWWERVGLPPAWWEPSISHPRGESDVSPTCVV